MTELLGDRVVVCDIVGGTLDMYFPNLVEKDRVYTFIQKKLAALINYFFPKNVKFSLLPINLFSYVVEIK